jgi:hypothetical protein
MKKICQLLSIWLMLRNRQKLLRVKQGKRRKRGGRESRYKRKYKNNRKMNKKN